ncbi:hypothetical protein [Paenibacillus qinlingensis]|nr:hypothetical protein [Paenibacillus qinlingensis]
MATISIKNTLESYMMERLPLRAFSQKYLHFVPVVGFDDEYFYLADSLEHTINCNGTRYNRKILVHDFEALWKIWVLFEKILIS